jgi:hypothetical protein
LALSVPLSRFTPRVGGGSAFFVRRLMRVISTIISLAFIFAFSGCASNSLKNARPVSLRPDQFVGHSLSLLSDAQVEQYDFRDDGVVLACLGSKEIVTGPVLHWQIVDGDTLTMTDLPEVSISYQFRSLSKQYAVTMDGKRFKRE